MSQIDGSRRDRNRAALLQDIRDEGYRLIGAAGPSAVTMSGIAHAVGLTGTALYRYFPSQEALVQSLLAGSFVDSAAESARVLKASADEPADVRLRLLLRGLRAWAIGHPVQYRIVTGSVSRGSALDVDAIVRPEDRPLSVIRALIHEARAARAPERTGPVTDAMLALRTYSRLHGVMSLQISGGLAPEVADELFDVELAWLDEELGVR